MRWIELTLEISATDSKSGNAETYDLTAESTDEMAQKIVETWLDRCNDDWTETTRTCLREFAEGLGFNNGTTTSDRAVNSAYSLANHARKVSA